MKFLQIFFIVSFCSVSMPTLAFADANTSAAAAAPTTKKEPRKQTLTFEDELVEGSTAKPDLFYLFQKKNFNFKRMMKLRNDFIPEMKRSTEDVQRGRSNN